MKPRHAKPVMTRQHNHVAAFSKASTAPLERLTPAMIDSIAASHARRGTPAFDKLLADLQAVVENRKAMAS